MTTPGKQIADQLIGNTISNITITDMRSVDPVQVRYARAQRLALLPGGVGMDWLDVGAGAGRFARVLGVEGHRVIAVDPLLDEGQEEGLRVTYRPGYAEQLPVADNTIDRVSFMWSFHHTDQAKALAEAARVMKPHGRLLIMTMDYDKLSNHWLHPELPSWLKIEQRRFAPLPELQKQLESNGFLLARSEAWQERQEMAPDEIADRIEQRWASTLHIIPAAERRAAVDRLRAKAADSRGSTKPSKPYVIGFLGLRARLRG